MLDSFEAVCAFPNNWTVALTSWGSSSGEKIEGGERWLGSLLAVFSKTAHIQPNSGEEPQSTATRPWVAVATLCFLWDHKLAKTANLCFPNHFAIARGGFDGS